MNQESCRNTSIAPFASTWSRIAVFALVAPALAACSSSGNSGGDGGGGPSSFTVSTSAGAGGSISPSSASVTQGSTASFTVATLPSHTLVGVSGCGGALSDDTYTTAAVTGACTVTATFALNSYTVSASAGNGGSIDPGSASVDHGETASFTVAADFGYEIDGVVGCGGSLSSDSFTTGEITGNCSVTATFTEADTVPAQVSATAGNEQVTVAWTAVAGATAYNLYWSSQPGIHPGTAASYDAFAEGVTSPHVVTSLVNDETYYFVVTAIFDAIESEPSTEVSARPTAVTGGGDIRTLTHLIDIETGAAAPLHVIVGNAFAIAGEEVFVIPGGGTRELWSFRTATGEVEYLMDAGDHSTSAAGNHLLETSPDGELIALNGSTTFIAMDLESRTSRAFDNLDVEAGTSADFAVAGNGNIVAKAADGGVVILDRDGATVVGSGGQGTGVSALAGTPDGRVVGIRGAVSTGSAMLVEIDADTGLVTELGTVPEVEAEGGGVQRVLFAATAAGYFASEARTSDPGSIFFIEDGTHDVAELALPEGVEVGLHAALDVDADGDVYAKLQDRRAVASNWSYIVLRMSANSDDSQIAIGYQNPGARHGALGPQGDLFYTSTTSGAGVRERLFRQDRRTGGVTVVTSEAVDGAVLVNADVLAVVGDSAYVISTRPDGEFLVHVDIASGEQTELSALGAPPAGGDRWFVNTMYPDPLSGDLILGNTGGHTPQQGCCGSVARLATAPASVPEVIAAGFGGGAPRDIKVRPDGSILFLNGDVGIYAVDPNTGAHVVLVEHPEEIGSPSAFVPLDDGTFAVFDSEYTDADDTWDGHTVWVVDSGTGQTTELLVDRPSLLTLGWPYLFRIP